MLLCVRAVAAEPPGKQAAPAIVEWERGIALKLPESGPDMYLWFYEWNMFEAMAPGQHTHGTYQGQQRSVSPDGRSAGIHTPALHLTVKTFPGGADLVLRITNTTAHQWPEIAGIIPCWSPGQVEGTDPNSPLPLNRNFADPARAKTFFMSETGLTPLASREIHFNRRLRALADRAAGGLPFAFSYKWPTSGVDAAAGFIVRASEDNRWVTGVGWEDYLSVQGHNPWSCMHACVRAGPLAPGQSKTVRGKLYLFRGTVAECVRRFQGR